MKLAENELWRAGSMRNNVSALLFIMLPVLFVGALLYLGKM